MIGIGVGGAEILPAMESMDQIELVAGADIVPATLERFAERYPKARTYLSAKDLCDDANVEAVWVSSPNRLHADHAIMAAERGKHVVVEKPMATTLEDANRMVEAAERNGALATLAPLRRRSAPCAGSSCRDVTGTYARSTSGPIRIGCYGRVRKTNLTSLKAAAFRIAGVHTKSTQSVCSAAACCVVCAPRSGNG